MKTSNISANEVQYKKTNTGKKLGTTAGLAAGVAVNVQNAKPLLGYINRNFDKIHAKYPNIQGNVTDVFKSYLTPAKSKNPWVSIMKSFIPTSQKKGIVIGNSTAAIAKKSTVMAGIVAAGALIGLGVGAVADKIKNNKLKQQAELRAMLMEKLSDKIQNAHTISLDDFEKMASNKKLV